MPPTTAKPCAPSQGAPLIRMPAVTCSAIAKVDDLLQPTRGAAPLLGHGGGGARRDGHDIGIA